MLIYIQRQNNIDTIKTPYNTTYILYRQLTNGKLKLIDNNEFTTPVFITGSYNNHTFGLYCQPYDPKHVPDNSQITGSVVGQNILNNTSGLLETTEITEFYKLAMQIGENIDNVIFNRINRYIEPKHEGKFTLNDSGLVAYLVSNPARVYFGYETDFVKGEIEIKAYNKQYIPLSIIEPINSISFYSVKPIKQFTGRIDIEESIWLEPIWDKDDDTLIANFFGNLTGLTYKSINLQTSILDFYGLDFDGKNIYQLVKTTNDNTFYSNTVSDHASATVLIKYNLTTEETESFAVQYDPIYANGIRVINGLLLINDLHGVVISELVDATPEYDVSSNTVTVQFPFTKYAITSYPIGEETLAGTIDDNPQIDGYQVRIWGQFQDKLMQLNSTVDLTSYRVDEDLMSYGVNYTLTPTYIDSLAYLYSIDRMTFEPFAELFARVYHQNQNNFFPLLYLYPIPIDATYTTTSSGIEIVALDPQTLPATYGLLTISNYKTRLKQLKDYTILFQDTTAMKTELKDVLDIIDDYLLERTNVLDNTVDQPLVLVDTNNKPVQVKYYLRQSILINNELIKVDGSKGTDYWKYPKVLISEFFNDETVDTNIDNKTFFIKDPSFDYVAGQQHTYYTEELSFRNIQAGRLVGIVKNKNGNIEIGYLFN